MVVVVVVVVVLREVVVDQVLEVVLVVAEVQVHVVGHLAEVEEEVQVGEVLVGVELEVVPEEAPVVVVHMFKEKENMMVKEVVQVPSAIPSQRGDSTKLDLNQLHSNHWNRITKVMVVVDMTRITNGTKIHPITSNGAKLLNHFT